MPCRPRPAAPPRRPARPARGFGGPPGRAAAAGESPPPDKRRAAPASQSPGQRKRIARRSGPRRRDSLQASRRSPGRGDQPSPPACAVSPVDLEPPIAASHPSPPAIRPHQPSIPASHPSPPAIHPCQPSVPTGHPSPQVVHHHQAGRPPHPPPVDLARHLSHHSADYVKISKLPLTRDQFVKSASGSSTFRRLPQPVPGPCDPACTENREASDQATERAGDIMKMTSFLHQTTPEFPFIRRDNRAGASQAHKQSLWMIMCLHMSWPILRRSMHHRRSGCAAICAMNPGDAPLYAPFVIIFAAIRAISVPYGASSGAFRPIRDERTRERTQETTNEPTDSTNKPGESTNEPRNPRTNPGCQDVAPGLSFSRCFNALACANLRRDEAGAPPAAGERTRDPRSAERTRARLDPPARIR